MGVCVLREGKRNAPVHVAHVDFPHQLDRLPS